jgi:hypothetical protein
MRRQVHARDRSRADQRSSDPRHARGHRRSSSSSSGAPPVSRRTRTADAPPGGLAVRRCRAELVQRRAGAMEPRPCRRGCPGRPPRSRRRAHTRIRSCVSGRGRVCGADRVCKDGPGVCARATRRGQDQGLSGALRADGFRCGPHRSRVATCQRRERGRARPDLPVELLGRVGYWGKPEGARDAFLRLAEGLDIAVVRLVPARRNDLAAVRVAMKACAPG